MQSYSKGFMAIIVLAFLLRLFTLGLLVYGGDQTIFFTNDSSRFMAVAENILQGHGMSKDTIAPYTPSADFPPLYSLLIAGSLWAGGSIIPLLVLQCLLAALFPLLVWQLAGFFSESPRVRLLAAALAAFEPQMLIWNLLVATEVVSVFLLLLSLLFFLKLPVSSRRVYAVLAGGFLAFSILTKPHAEFLLPLGFAYLLFLAFHARERWRQAFVIALLFFGSGLLVLSPWLVRNYIRFHTVTIASTGLRNIFSDVGPSILQIQNGGSFNDARNELYSDIAAKYHISQQEIFNNPAHSGLVAREGFKIIAQHPQAFLRLIFIVEQAFFTQDLYLDYARYFHLIPQFSFGGFSPSVILLSKGPFALARMIYQNLGAYMIIPIVGRLLWIAVDIFALWGLLSVFRNEKGKGFLLLIVAAVILYYALTSLVGGFTDQGRLRYPVNSLLFILASVGWYRHASRTPNILFKTESTQAVF